MAMTTTLVPSPTLKSAFSPYTDSPSSPAPYGVVFRAMNRVSAGSNTDSLAPPPSPYPATVDPSPVESNDSHSTDVTDIDADDVQSPLNQVDGLKSPDIEIVSPASGQSPDDVAPLPHIDTNIISRGSDDGQPQSVIHAPSGFKQFEGRKSPKGSHKRGGSGSEPSEASENTAVVSPTTPESADRPDAKKSHGVGPPLNTAVQPALLGSGTTPRASTMQEADEEWRRRSWASSKNLEDIAEADDPERPDTSYTNISEASNISEALKSLNTAEQEVASLRTALSECWTLCNTLANLSSMHRERMFTYAGSGEVQEQAWKSCWRLCQNLYESRDEDHAAQVRPTLELCREFCQALFEARHRGDEVTDSILRVSFELNNHLYNTHDRNLPDAFRERTLDFYLTMCHRLMKQRTSLPEETDSLLRACWALAELLFSLRQNNRENRPVDEELLGSAVQACWDLCDLFRDGWTQMRPERGTPRPNKTTFSKIGFPQRSGSESTSSRPESSASGTFHSVKSFPPETPTTIYDEREEMSPAEMAVPNILVLGPDRSNMQWSSNSSVTSSSLSGYSESSQRTTRSAGRGMQATPTPPQQEPEDPNLVCLKALIIKAAHVVGFGRQSPTTLTAFVKTLPSTAFGAQPWQMKLFESYRKLVLTDPTLRGDQRAILPNTKRLSASEIGRAVSWMARNEAFLWFKDLYRLVFSFGPEEAASKKGVTLSI